MESNFQNLESNLLREESITQALPFYLGGVMSMRYDDYLFQHRDAVSRAFNWMEENIHDVIYGRFFDYDDISNMRYEICFKHDASKNLLDEYEPYDAYFYGRNKSYQVVQDFNRAWLEHIHRNPHHWQYWVLINDDPNEGIIALDMPSRYIIEMVCDWWAFSWIKESLDDIFAWYDEHKDYMTLSDRTSERVDIILNAIYAKLHEEDDSILQHHGIKGQKWGIKNGPPYPLTEASGNKNKQLESRSLNISRNKFAGYALNPSKAPDKARVFKSALGYDLDNCDQLIKDLEKQIDVHKMKEKGDNGYGMRYEQIIKLNGPNGKDANVLTAWLDDGENLKLTSTYVVDKEESK